MAFYDEERILEDANAVSVAEYLGMEIRRSASRYQIYCPGHLNRLGKEDKKMGSCFLTPKGYHCYACDKTVSLPNMVMEVEGCDYKEALGIIADSLGGRDHYVLSGKKEFVEETEKILPEEDLKIIGLRSVISIDTACGFYETKEEIEEINNRNRESDDEELRRKIYSIKPEPFTEGYTAILHETYSLKTFFQEYPEEYYDLIRNKSKEAMEKYKNMLDSLDNKESNMYKTISFAIKNAGINSEIYDISEIIKKWYNKSKEIYLSITPDMTGVGEEEIEEEKPAKKKIRYDLFKDVR